MTTLDKPQKLSTRKFEHLMRVSRSQLSARALRAAIVVTNFIDEREGDACKKSVTFLAAAMGVSRSTFERAVRELGNANLYTVDATRTGKTNLIRMVELSRQNSATSVTMLTGVSDHESNVQNEAPPVTMLTEDPRQHGDTPVSYTFGSAGRPEAGPASEPSDSLKVEERHREEEVDARQDAPDAAPLRAAGATVAPEDLDEWSFFDFSERPPTALSAFRDENSGEMPTKSDLEAFAAEHGLPITTDDLTDIASHEADLYQDEGTILADLRAGRQNDRSGQHIVVPATDGTATTMLRTARRRAVYVSQACQMAEQRRPTERLAFWQHRKAEIASALRVEGADTETAELLALATAEFLTELRRREAITRNQLAGERA